MDIKKLKEEFLTLYGDGEVRFFASPGRVNLIGEHTDYNGGFVFPAALKKETIVAARKRSDNIIRLKATDLDEIVVLDLDNIDNYKNIKYGNYQAGVISVMQEDGFEIKGADLLYFDGVPHGGGLSSSAAIEVATAITFATFSEEAGKKGASATQLALIGQRAENTYVGVNCGIMDQFTSAHGREGYAIFLNCKDLSFKRVPLKLEGYKIVISNTNKKHKLGESKYNERRAECEEGLLQLSKVLQSKTCLGDITLEEFLENKSAIKDETILKRVQHIITEDDRVQKSVSALFNGDIKLFGKQMNESHNSLRDLYEVTGIELDTLANEAQKIEGVMGSRMTGAGFGGCTVSIVKDDKVDEFINRVGNGYRDKIGLEPTFYVSLTGDGAREII